MGQKDKWLDPNQVSGRQAERYCRICGSEATQVRILKHANICEDCVENLRQKKKESMLVRAVVK